MRRIGLAEKLLAFEDRLCSIELFSKQACPIWMYCPEFASEYRTHKSHEYSVSIPGRVSKKKSREHCSLYVKCSLQNIYQLFVYILH
jgi:hypothetical protein